MYIICTYIYYVQMVEGTVFNKAFHFSIKKILTELVFGPVETPWKLKPMKPSHCIDNRAEVVVGQNPWRRSESTVHVSIAKGMQQVSVSQSVSLRIASEAHISRTLRHFCTLDAHGHTNVCLVQGRSIVHLKLLLLPAQAILS